VSRLRITASRCVIAGVALCMALPGVGTAGAGSHAQIQDGANGRAWLALGDSYASGEGIPGTVPEARQSPAGDRGDMGRNCQRATGEGTNATAWAVGAFRQEQARLGLERQAFVACTGAITDEITTEIQEAESDLGRSRWDIVSLSIGGNNIRFSNVVRGCLDLANGWDVFDLTPGCDVTEDQLRRRIDMLVGNRPIEPRQYEGSRTLPETLDLLADHTVSGGDVIVTGYPNLVEETRRWSRWRRDFTGNCEGIESYDVGMLRNAAGYLNQQIGQAVIDADERHADEGIHFHFVDISRDPYEYSDDPGSRHALCSRDPWLNGVTTSITAGDVRTVRSFHPRQVGHTNTARVVAGVIEQDVTFDDAVGVSSSEFAGLVGCGVGCSVTGVIEFDHPTWGPSYLVTTEPAGTANGDVSITALDAQGTTRWRYDNTTFYAMSPVGVQDSYSGIGPKVDHAVDANGHLFVNYNPGRYNGVIVLEPTADGFEDFDTLPPVDDYQGVFYYGEVVSETADGAFIIEVSSNDCVPDCAGGTVTSVDYAFDGSSYAPLPAGD